MGFAHGKVLLFGEHAVVWGQPAIAAGLSCGLTAYARLGTEPARLQVPAWSLEVLLEDPAHRVARACRALFDAMDVPISGWNLEVDAALPAGAGLGSSAALAVSLARAVAQATGQTLSDQRLFDVAMAAERVFHGQPSGLDHAAAIHGGVFTFLRPGGAAAGAAPVLSPLEVGAPLSFLIAQVEAGADTGRMVAGVATRRSAAPTVILPVLDAIGGIVAEATAAIAAGDAARLGLLMDLNHGLLGALGVSTPTLDAACWAARQAGALGAKLTGAGGGGCLVAVVDPSLHDAVGAALRPWAAHVLVHTMRPGSPSTSAREAH